jgi:hypothetical protein
LAVAIYRYQAVIFLMDVAGQKLARVTSAQPGPEYLRCAADFPPPCNHRSASSQERGDRSDRRTGCCLADLQACRRRLEKKRPSRRQGRSVNRLRCLPPHLTALSFLAEPPCPDRVGWSRLAEPGLSPRRDRYSIHVYRTTLLAFVVRCAGALQEGLEVFRSNSP